MSRRSSACSRGKDPNSIISSKFANSPYLESVQPRQSLAHKQKEKAKKCQDEEGQEKPLVVVQPKQSQRGGRGGRSIKTHVPRGSDSVNSYISIRSSKTRQSSGLSHASSIGRARIAILLPSEVDKLLVAFSSKHKDDNHLTLAQNNTDNNIVEDDSTIASATSMDDNHVYRDCKEEVFSSDLFANISLARDPDSTTGPTLTLEAAVDDDISDLDSVVSDTKPKLAKKKISLL